VLLRDARAPSEPERRIREGCAAALARPIGDAELFKCLASAAAPAGSVEELSQTRLIARQSLDELRARARLHVLVAEDNSVNQRVAALTLERLGYRCTIAANGREALAALERSQFDAVLMDCQMPELDGFETTRRIRAAEVRSGAHLPVIAMTANAMAGDREACLAAGMDDYVAKPFSPQELLEILERWMQRPAHANALERSA
jgi:CheY-like chemotaxis protein